jgi:hypothetical protein
MNITYQLVGLNYAFKALTIKYKIRLLQFNSINSTVYNLLTRRFRNDYISKINKGFCITFK